jgi:hypothetical protein
VPRASEMSQMASVQDRAGLLGESMCLIALTYIYPVDFNAVYTAADDDDDRR